jgi:hypothetical protein
MLFSSNWNNAANAGPLYFDANHPASNVNANIGTQLANFVKIDVSIYPAPWQNTTTSKHYAGRSHL